MIMAIPLRADEPVKMNVAEIQAKHDRALIRDLTEYLGQNPKADDRDQAYSNLFNKAIEHDWFSETEATALAYLKAEPEGPVAPLAQIVVTMARAQAGRFEEALDRFKDLMKGIGQAEQEEFASSFAENFAGAAISAGEFHVARQVFETLLSRFEESPNLKQKVQQELARIDKVGKLAPSFSTVDIDGKAVRLDSFKGKYVLVDFWATWCGPCIVELPRLQRAYEKYHAAGLEIIAVSLDETRGAVADFVKARKLPWPQVHNSSSNSDIVEAFGVASIPANFLIDPEGNVIRLDLRGASIEQALEKVFKGSKPLSASANP
ncbi:MAG: peroxiredoxin [Planctomycetes bacterium SCN 63-9]|nr:MAG: peroxiredoxin [Planctomycetes bacterium SCN 63-9]